jgi:hypothetical protein
MSSLGNKSGRVYSRNCDAVGRLDTRSERGFAGSAGRYDNIRPELGERFALAVDATVEAIAEHPTQFPVIQRNSLSSTVAVDVRECGASPTEYSLRSKSTGLWSSRASTAGATQGVGKRGNWVVRQLLLGRLGKYLLEESLLGRGLPQCSVAIHVRRQPALKSFGLEYRAMNWVVVAHR